MGQLFQSSRNRGFQHSKFCLAQGGAGSSYQALAAGVPLGCGPGHLNHIVLAERLEELKAGVLLEPASWQDKLAVTAGIGGHKTVACAKDRLWNTENK